MVTLGLLPAEDGFVKVVVAGSAGQCGRTGPTWQWAGICIYLLQWASCADLCAPVALPRNPSSIASSPTFI